MPLVLHVIHRLDYGGLENGVVNLINRMARDRVDHAVVALSGVNPAFRRRIVRDDVKIFDLEKKPGKDFACYFRMRSLLRSLRPHIVHSRNLSTIDMQWIAALSIAARRVHGEHGWEASDPQGLNRKNLFIRRACRPVIDCYVPMSRDISRWLVDSVGVDPARIRQIYSGVDTERFHPATSASATEGRPLVIGTIGRLDPIKNQAGLLQAFADLIRTRPVGSRAVKLVLVGDGPERERLRQRAADLKIERHVEFPGARDDTAELLRTFDLFVLPSFNEGISNTILEAMATGLPVVAAQVGGNPELVEHGATGLLYDPAEPAGLTESTRRYLDGAELRAAHGDAARRRTVERFSLEAMVDRYTELYESL